MPYHELITDVILQLLDYLFIAGHFFLIALHQIL